MSNSDDLYNALIKATEDGKIKWIAYSKHTDDMYHTTLDGKVALVTPGGLQIEGLFAEQARPYPPLAVKLMEAIRKSREKPKDPEPEINLTPIVKYIEGL